MTDLFKAVCLLLLTPECYDQYFIHFNFLDGECMKSTISKALGLLIVTGSVTVKVPQIMKIIKNKSGEGISLLGTVLDLCAISSFFLYSYLKKYPFSAWGDGLFLFFQTVAVIGLILYYKNLLPQLVLFLSTCSTVVILLLIEVIDIWFLWLLQFFNLPIIILGKGVQALTNYRNKSTGQLSAITCWMQFGGATARVFTSVQETGDMAVILSFVVASILNGIIVFQLLYYGGSKQKKTKSGKSKDKMKKKAE